MKDLSIEYAHIYTNSRISEEHELSLDILSKLRNEYPEAATSLVVMVDDYSFPDPSFDYESFAVWLAERGHRPDIVIRESQLIPVCDEVLKTVSDEKLKSQISDYVRAKKYPCSLFVAAWYLLRLGYLSASFFPKELVAKKVVNILPASFKPFEDKAIEILHATPFSEIAGQIENRYFEGRLVA